jgi:hypothetical protein
VLAPAQPAVGNQQNLQLPPPHAPSPLSRRPGQRVHGRDGGNLVLGDRPSRALPLGTGCPIGWVPAHAAQQVLAHQHHALVQTGIDDPGQAAPQMRRHRRGRGAVHDPLEVGPGAGG